ncbi:MAG: DUF4124 domain-containing protein [Burkholderiaceae bacterium]|nr:MAG: DUF4124 domain-containing protein [Burkholderiaceae bacterium]
MNSWLTPTALGLSLLALAEPGFALNRCVDAQGKVSYSDLLAPATRKAAASPSSPPAARPPPCDAMPWATCPPACDGRRRTSPIPSQGSAHALRPSRKPCATWSAR